MTTTRIESGLAPLCAEQQAVLDRWSGATAVLGVPGTGKTTLIGHAALRGIAAGGNPVVLVGSRTAASRLRNQISIELGEGSWQPVVTTVHALARTLWQRFSGRAEVRLLAAPEQEFRVRELLAGVGPDRWPAELRLAAGTRGFAAQVRTAIARARQLGLEPEDLVAFGEASGREVWSALGEFFTEYLDVLDAEGVLDYAELVHRARLLLADPSIAAQVSAEIDTVLVDDFADLDPSQLGLISMLAPRADVLATADPDSISAGFRGADPRAVRDFTVVFGSSLRPARLVQLQQGHRHGAAIGDCLAGLRSRLPRVQAPAVVRLPDLDADVRVLHCADEAEQAQAIVAALRRARVRDGIDFAQMAVLVRSAKQHTPSIWQALTAAGIPVRVAADEIPLAQAPAVRPLLLALSIAVAGEAQPDEAVRLLTSPMGGLDAVSLRAVARAWRVGRSEVAHLPIGTQVAMALNDPAWAHDHPLPAVGRLAALADLLDQASRRLAAAAAVDEVLWLLWRGTPWPNQLAAEAASAGASSGRADADLDALCALFETAAETDRRGGSAGVRAFLAELAGQQIPADRQRESRLAGRGVELLTAHRARGRQWQLVVVAGVQEGSWPAGRRLSTVIDADELDVNGLVGHTEPRTLLAAERRLFHLACSRAQRRLVVTATAGTEGESDAPSRFLAELGVPAQRPDADASPVQLSGLVTELRRAAVAAGAPDALRQAAAVELAWLADQTDHRGRPVAPWAQPSTWWGVRELTSLPQPDSSVVRLSPSQVNAALTCPRRYFLSRQGGGEGEISLAATLGSLIHRLIQSAVEEQWGLAELRDELDRVWDRLPFEAAWFSASERAEVEQALQRFLNWRARRHDAELVAVEAGFEVTLALDELSVQLVGKVDWLERTDTGLRVVDFKTARRQPTKDEIAGMDQLGIYQLAVAAGAFDQRVGVEGLGPQAASAVFLRLGDRPDDVPKEFWQQSLIERPFLSEEPSSYPSWVHERIAQAARIVADQRYPATPGPHCERCVFATSCPADPRGSQVIE